MCPQLHPVLQTLDHPEKVRRAACHDMVCSAFLPRNGETQHLLDLSILFSQSLLLDKSSGSEFVSCTT